MSHILSRIEQLTEDEYRMMSDSSISGLMDVTEVNYLAPKHAGSWHCPFRRNCGSSTNLADSQVYN